TLVFLIIAAPWHILAALRNPPQGEARGFLWFYFINEHVMRFVGKRVPPGYDTVPLVLFWVLLLAWLVPWSAFLPQAARALVPGWNEIRTRVIDRFQRAYVLFLLWPRGIVRLFSFSTRQEYYRIPVLPGVAVLIGGWLARESGPTASAADRRAGRISSLVLFAVGLIGFVPGMYLLSVSHRPAPGADLADLLKK